MHLQPQHERGGHSAAAAQQHRIWLVQPRAAHVERRAGEEAGVVDPAQQCGVRRGACLTAFLMCLRHFYCTCVSGYESEICKGKKLSQQ